MDPNHIVVPADVPSSYHYEYIRHYLQATFDGRGIIMLAGDQKVEHMNKDFLGTHVDQSDIDPHHLFDIASQKGVSLFATQLGLIARYGNDYPQVPYLVKMNSKTNAHPITDKDPISTSWYTIDDILSLKQNSGFPIVGIGFTVYIGSDFEHKMLREAAQLTVQAHHYGLLSILFMYPKGHSIPDEKKGELVIGAAATGAALGADFIKINMPMANESPDYISLQRAVHTCGRSKIIVAGGEHKKAEQLLETIYKQHSQGDTFGVALGRNLHQRSVSDARKLLGSLYEIIIEEATFERSLIHFSLT